MKLARPDPPLTAPGAARTRVIPILLYHAVSENPAAWIAPYTVTPGVFEAQMDAIAELGAATMTVSDFVDALRRDPRQLPDPLVLVTFDDGAVDVLEVALPAMLRRRIASTLYVTTGFADSARGPDGARMLGYRELGELRAEGVEIGGHSRTHAQLDTLPPGSLDDEVGGCKAVLENRLGVAVRSFAYPHGYSSPAVRRAVREAGYESACAVVNALSSSGEDPYRLARLTVRCDTSTAALAAWIRGRGAPVAPRAEGMRTRAWRTYRQAGVRLGVRGAVDL